jgi:hypothetical protein
MERRSAKDRSPLSIFNSKIYEPGNSPLFAKSRQQFILFSLRNCSAHARVHGVSAIH